MASRKRKREDDAEPDTPLVCSWRGCASCVFDNYEQLHEHVNTVHVVAKGPCLWNNCTYVGATKQSLQHHVRTHTGEKPYKCDECDFSCAQLGHLTTHKRTHTGEKPYKCDRCKAAFAQSDHLTKHKRTHTGEKPYKCNGCEAAFAQLGTLESHKRTHTGEKPYKCDKCDYSCSTAGSLTVHKRTHTGEKPYKCDVCKAAFTTSGKLTLHKRTHTGEKPYKCDECGAAFAQSFHLTKHKLRHHLGPWCVVCSECWVPEETMICGRCNMHSAYGAKERAFFDFIYAYDERLAQVCFTLRDEALGCGVRKRPDGLLQLKTKAACVDVDAAMEVTLVEDDYQVKVILECDENQHRAYEPSCELARLQAIQERDHDAVYVLRYNIDQPDGFDEAKLGAFCERVMAVLEGDFVRAIESPTLFEIEYFGYSEARRVLLETEMQEQLQAPP